LEREFQRRAEECARQEEEEEGEEEQVRVILWAWGSLGFCCGFGTQCVYVAYHIYPDVSFGFLTFFRI
jgi:hypothetical protein